MSEEEQGFVEDLKGRALEMATNVRGSTVASISAAAVGLAPVSMGTSTALAALLSGYSTYLTGQEVAEDALAVPGIEAYVRARQGIRNNEEVKPEDFGNAITNPRIRDGLAKVVSEDSGFDMATDVFSSVITQPFGFVAGSALALGTNVGANFIHQREDHAALMAVMAAEKQHTAKNGKRLPVVSDEASMAAYLALTNGSKETRGKLALALLHVMDPEAQPDTAEVNADALVAGALEQHLEALRAGRPQESALGHLFTNPHVATQIDDALRIDMQLGDEDVDAPRIAQRMSRYMVQQKVSYAELGLGDANEHYENACEMCDSGPQIPAQAGRRADPRQGGKKPSLKELAGEEGGILRDSGAAVADDAMEAGGFDEDPYKSSRRETRGVPAGKLLKKIFRR